MIIGISFEHDGYTLYPDGTRDLILKGVYSDGTFNIVAYGAIIISSDEYIAIIDNSGKVIPKVLGNALITA